MVIYSHRLIICNDQWMWRKLMYCFFVLMACQRRVCMCMRNTKYCIVEVASRQAFINLVLYENVKQYPFLRHFIHNKTAGALTFLFAPCMECCGDASFLRIPIDREESNVRKDKRITMAQ